MTGKALTRGNVERDGGGRVNETWDEAREIQRPTHRAGWKEKDKRTEKMAILQVIHL